MYARASFGNVQHYFGKGVSKEVGNELKKIGCKKVLFVTDPGIIKAGLETEILSSINEAGISYHLFKEVKPDPRSEDIAYGVQVYREQQCDGIVALGGGSSLDTGKSIAMLETNGGNIQDYDFTRGKPKREIKKRNVPFITIPTTTGTGSELSHYAVVTRDDENRKAVFGSPLMDSWVALCDPMLTMKLPPSITASTAIDAFAHILEAYTSKETIEWEGKYFVDPLAEQGMQLIIENVEACCQENPSYEERANLMWGSTLGGFVLEYGSGAAHGFSHRMSTEHEIAHGAAIAMLLPYIMEYNLDCCPERYARLTQLFGVDTSNMDVCEAAEKSVDLICEWLKRLPLPSMKQYIQTEEQLAFLAEQAVLDHCTLLNPRKIEFDDAMELYHRAFNDEKGIWK